MSTELKPTIDRQLADLARQIRNQRLVRGFCWLALLLVMMIAGFWLVDFFYPLSSATLRVIVTLVLAVLLLGSLLTFAWSTRRIDSLTLAAKIEQKHPELGERLLSTVALSNARDHYHGNSQFIDLLRQEVEDFLARTDLKRSFATPANRRLSLLAGVGLVCIVVLFILWSAQSNLAGRLLGAPEQPASRENTTLLPVRLAEEPLVTITPPAYVNPTVHPVQETRGFQALSALEHSDIVYRFRFDRRATSCSVELEGSEGKPVALTGDGLGGSFSVPRLRPGAYRMTLILDGRFRHELPALEIWPDEPPRIAEILIDGVPADSLGDKALVIPPTDVIPLKVTVEDKVGVGAVELEYRINDGPVRIRLIAAGKGNTSITKEFMFKAAETLKSGDFLKFRVKAGDNRLLPARKLGPQIVYYPADRWLEAKIADSAKPLPEQDILAQRERVHSKVQEIIKKIKEERADLVKVRNELDGTSPHQSADWDGKLEKVRQKNRDIQQDLHFLALDQGASEVLHPLATQAWEIAARELKESDQAMNRAKAKTLSVERREQHLQAADDNLVRALRRLEELIDANQRLAEDRLDHLKLEKLAGDQELLGGKAGKDLTPEELAQLQAGENRLLDEMNSLAKTSKLVQESLNAAREEQMRKLDALAKTPEGETLQKEFAPQLSVLGKKQKELAGKMAGVGMPTKEAEEAAKALDLGHMHRAMQFQQSAMKKLEHLGKEGTPTMPKNDPKTMAQLAKEQKELNLSLKQIASAMADKMSFKMGSNKGNAKEPSNQAKAGQAMKLAQKQMEDALLKLKLGKTQEARPAMQQAARNLKQAAMSTKQHMTRSQQAGVPGTAQQNPGKSPPTTGGKAKSGPLRPDLKKYSAEAWGRMPEHLRSRMLQDLRAQFGEDYARIIQGYFEKINDER